MDYLGITHREQRLEVFVQDSSHVLTVLGWVTALVSEGTNIVFYIFSSNTCENFLRAGLALSCEGGEGS